MTPDRQRPLRADARRNRERILGIARETFAAEGIAVPLDEIARRAGVGAGTVHRHFPTKEALFDAVVVEYLEELIRDAHAALAEAGPGEAFFGFLRRMTGQADAKQDLASALGATSAQAEEAAARLREVFAALLERAQEAGAVRRDVDDADARAVVIGAIAAHRHRSDGGERPERVAELVISCLRPATPE